jgi:hypothetical protein
MADLNLPPGQTPISGPGGFAPHGWRRFFEVIAQRLGGSTDNVALALELGEDAVPKTTQIIVSSGLVGGGDLTDNVAVGLYRFINGVAALPTTDILNGQWAYAVDARNSGETAGNGSGSPVVWNAANSWWQIPGAASAVTA